MPIAALAKPCIGRLIRAVERNGAHSTARWTGLNGFNDAPHAQIEKLTVAGARLAGMGLRSGHLVALGTAIHDTLQVTAGHTLSN